MTARASIHICLSRLIPTASSGWAFPADLPRSGLRSMLSAVQKASLSRPSAAPDSFIRRSLPVCGDKLRFFALGRDV